MRADIRASAARAGARVWRASGQPGMRAVTVVERVVQGFIDHYNRHRPRRALSSRHPRQGGRLQRRRHPVTLALIVLIVSFTSTSEGVNKDSAPSTVFRDDSSTSCATDRSGCRPPRTLYSPVMIPTGRVVLEMKRAGNA